MVPLAPSGNDDPTKCRAIDSKATPLRQYRLLATHPGAVLSTSKKLAQSAIEENVAATVACRLTSNSDRQSASNPVDDPGP